MRKAWVNGEDSQTASLLDRGLAYGDGLFETLLYESGHVRLLDLHLSRLQAGAKKLRIQFAIDTLQGELQGFVHQAREEGLVSDADKAVLKIILSRGVGGRGYRFPEKVSTQRSILLFDHPAYPLRHRKEGIQIRLCKTPVSVNPALAGLKHLNRLDNVMARSEWDCSDIQEGLMLDEQGAIIEGTMSNVFIVRDSVLITPSLKRAGVAGVMRAHLLDMARKHKVETCISESVSVQQLYDADEVFVCNSVLGVWPVIRLGPKQWSVGRLTRLAQSWIQDVCCD
jgi:4-amino-4-deoxychorismate lyase